jgi:hypothetical protein
MRSFLLAHRDELIARCAAKVAGRLGRAASAQQLADGIPTFLDQLTRTFAAEQEGDRAEGVRISGPSGGDATALSEIGVTASAHGGRLLELGYTVDQVVHDYGDLCQAITDLAVERDAPFSVDHFRTLNRCLDNAIADAVAEFSLQRDVAMAQRQGTEENERLGMLVHEMRNFLQTATMAYAALESGKVPVTGATGGLLKRSLDGLTTLVDRSLAEVRSNAAMPEIEVFSLASLIAEARNVASLSAVARGCSFAVPEVDPRISVRGNRERLLAALVNLLQNAFKFTHRETEVTLHAHARGGRILIDVADHCGGLPPKFAESMFLPFQQHGHDRSGLGLGLSVARKCVEAEGGFLRVRDRPGTGCVFTMDLPCHELP